MCYVNTNKKVSGAVLMPDKVDFTSRNVTSSKVLNDKAITGKDTILNMRHLITYFKMYEAKTIGTSWRNRKIRNVRDFTTTQ